VTCHVFKFILTFHWNKKFNAYKHVTLHTDWSLKKKLGMKKFAAEKCNRKQKPAASLAGSI
jgi:hypothetical protein